MQYQAFDEGTEVLGRTIGSVVNAMPKWKDFRASLLDQHGISDLQDDVWYSQSAWLSVFESIGAVAGGQHLLFAIGKAIPENAAVVPASSLRDALEGIQASYESNHRNGHIGFYRLTAFDSLSGSATMVCRNPYPSEFDRGLILGFVSRFTSGGRVRLDTSEPCRATGADSCTYLIDWTEETGAS